MTKEEILKILESAKDKNADVPMRLVRQAFEKLPEPCEDAVDRKAIVELVSSWLNHAGYSEGEINVMRCIIQSVQDMPSVAPVCLITGKSDEVCPLCEIREGKT